MSEQQKDAMLLFMDALEAAITKYRQDVGAKTVREIESFDPDKIAWKDAKGERGPFQLTEDFENAEYRKMLVILQGGGGSVGKGKHFYWVFPDGKVVGRKEHKKKET